MPSMFSFLRHNRKSTPPSTDDAQRDKLKKRTRFSTSDLRGLSRVVSNNAPSESTPRLPRSSRISTSVRIEVPEMPSIPIYETLSSGKHLSLFADDRSRLDGTSTAPRQPRRIATIGDFQSLRPRSGQALRYITATTPDKPPVYDRAVELGKFYRSILPDFQTMCGEDDNTAADTGEIGRNEGGQRQRGQENTSSATPLTGEVREETSGKGGNAHAVPLDLRPGPARNDSSVASSTTAVESDELDHIPTRQHHLRDRGARPQSGSAWLLSTGGPSTEPTPQTTLEPTPARTTHVLGGGRDRSRIINQHSSVGLHICTDLLVDLLTKALALQRQDCDPRPSNPIEEESERRQGQSASNPRQLQVLLLIEAYEGVLRRCKREVSSSSSSRGEGSNAPGDRGRNGVGEAVPVLEHWLDTLHRLYEEGFGEDDAD